MDILTAGGNLASFATRDDTSDGALIMGIIGESEYPFARMQNLTGWALDAGAHIGIVSVALGLDNPDLKILAVEPVAENAAILRQNIARNGLNERVFVIEAALGEDGETELVCAYTKAGAEPEGYVHDNRFIGNLYTSGDMDIKADRRTVESISISTLVLRYAIDRIAFMKSDTEGSEWVYLKDKAMNRVMWLIGEAHAGPGLPGLRKMLPKHKVEQIDDLLVNFIFEAKLKGAAA